MSRNSAIMRDTHQFGFTIKGREHTVARFYCNRCRSWKRCAPGAIHTGNPHDAFIRNPQIAIDDWAERAARDLAFHIIDKDGHRHDYTVEAACNDEDIQNVVTRVRAWRACIFGVTKTLADLRGKGVQFHLLDQTSWFEPCKETGGQKLKALPTQVISVVDTDGQVYHIPRQTVLTANPITAYHQWLRSFRLVLSSLFPKGAWEVALQELYANRKADDWKAMQDSDVQLESRNTAVSREAALDSYDYDFSTVPDQMVSLVFPADPPPYTSHEELVEADDEDPIFGLHPIQGQMIPLDSYDWDYPDMSVPLTFETRHRNQAQPRPASLHHPKSKQPAKQGGLCARDRIWSIRQDLYYDATLETDHKDIAIIDDTALESTDYLLPQVDVSLEFRSHNEADGRMPL